MSSKKEALINERNTYHEKAAKLMTYIISPRFADLSPEMQDLLKRQVDALDVLEKILVERIARVAG